MCHLIIRNIVIMLSDQISLNLVRPTWNSRVKICHGKGMRHRNQKLIESLALISNKYKKMGQWLWDMNGSRYSHLRTVSNKWTLSKQTKLLPRGWRKLINSVRLLILPRLLHFVKNVLLKNVLKVFQQIIQWWLPLMKKLENWV